MKETWSRTPGTPVFKTQAIMLANFGVVILVNKFLNGWKLATYVFSHTFR